MKFGEFVAIDLGASSGRIVLGRVSGKGISTRPVHRFPNYPVRAGGTLYWDVLGIYREIIVGLRIVSERSQEITRVSRSTRGASTTHCSTTQARCLAIRSAIGTTGRHAPFAQFSAAFPRANSTARPGRSSFPLIRSSSWCATCSQVDSRRPGGPYFSPTSSATG